MPLHISTSAIFRALRTTLEPAADRLLKIACCVFKSRPWQTSRERPYVCALRVRARHSREVSSAASRLDLSAPVSVHRSWRISFAGLSKTVPARFRMRPASSLTPRPSTVTKYAPTDSYCDVPRHFANRRNVLHVLPRCEDKLTSSVLPLRANALRGAIRQGTPCANSRLGVMPRRPKRPRVTQMPAKRFKQREKQRISSIARRHDLTYN